MRVVILITAITGLLIFSNRINAQGYTKDNFKLTFDNYPFNNNIIILSKAQLFDLKELKTNLKWAEIKSFHIDFISLPDSINWSCKLPLTSIMCKGNLLTSEFYKIVKEHVSFDMELLITPEISNKNGDVIEWNSLSIIVRVK